MPFLTDVELLLGLSRHLRAYQMGPERAALEQLELAGQALDMAFRLRGSTTSPAPRVQAIALEAGVGRRSLREVIGLLEGLGWISVTRDAQYKPLVVSETIPVPGVIVTAAAALLDIVSADPVERAALGLLRATTLQPLTVEDALIAAAQGAGAGGSDLTALAAVRHLEHTKLVRRILAADGREVLYNPNIWVQGDDTVARAALKAADARATSEIGALLQELADNPGMPEVQVQSTERRWVTFAISQGLIQRSVIQTADGGEQGFLFTPHLGRDPFGGTAGDASGQVRQLVGSMMYATTFAKYKLRDPSVFLIALLERGRAGNVTSIGTDYPMLEKAGIVRVVPGHSEGRFSLELLQAEVAEDAIGLLRAKGEHSVAQSDITSLEGQRSYLHADEGRARLALTTEVDEVEQARLVAALRDETVRPSFRGQA